MNCSTFTLIDFVEKNKKRKTVSKKEAFDMIKLSIEACYHAKHLPPCYYHGDPEPKLSGNHIKENEVIDHFNEHIESVLKETKKILAK